jgi:hypothetical protein
MAASLAVNSAFRPGAQDPLLWNDDDPVPYDPSSSTDTDAVEPPDLLVETDSAFKPPFDFSSPLSSLGFELPTPSQFS